MHWVYNHNEGADMDQLDANHIYISQAQDRNGKDYSSDKEHSRMNEGSISWVVHLEIIKDCFAARILGDKLITCDNFPCIISDDLEHFLFSFKFLCFIHVWYWILVELVLGCLTVFFIVKTFQILHLFLTSFVVLLIEFARIVVLCFKISYYLSLFPSFTFLLRAVLVNSFFDQRSWRFPFLVFFFDWILLKN